MATGLVQSLVDGQKEWLDKLSDSVQPLVNNAFSGAGDTGRTLHDLLNGVWLGHPLHPMLTDVPIGAWTITELLDGLSLTMGDDEGLDRAADISLGFGLLASVPTILAGLTDWSDTYGEQRRVGMAHAAVNTGALVLYLASLALRGGKRRGLARFFSAAGFAANASAAYIAGDLVYTLGQGVNRNAWVSSPKKYTDVTAEDELTDGKMTKFDLKGGPVVLVKHDDGLHAFSATCPHAGCNLASAKLDGHILTCQCHGSTFDIADGSLIHGPATVGLPLYETRVRSGRVEVRLEQPPE